MRVEDVYFFCRPLRRELAGSASEKRLDRKQRRLKGIAREQHRATSTRAGIARLADVGMAVRDEIRGETSRLHPSEWKATKHAAVGGGAQIRVFAAVSDSSEDTDSGGHWRFHTATDRRGAATEATKN